MLQPATYWYVLFNPPNMVGMFKLHLVLATLLFWQRGILPCPGNGLGIWATPESCHPPSTVFITTQSVVVTINMFVDPIALESTGWK